MMENVIENGLPRIIAVDFDGTLCFNNWPNIGKPRELVVNYVKNQKKAGAKIILWTCRTGFQLNEAVEWCKNQGIELDAVNENLPESIYLFGGDSRKIFAHEYLDDKNCSRFKFG
jgi:hydroxymethylpyrimidine pyrophosphatase-like HAD family hydrolase